MLSKIVLMAFLSFQPEFDEGEMKILQALQEEVKAIKIRKEMALTDGCPFEPGTLWNLECA